MKKILVIGESCRDIFVYCKAERLAPDLPIPVLSVVEQKENPGMAANVERNIKSIFPDVNLYTNEKWKEITKTRYMHCDTNHIFIRVDTDHHIPRIKVENVPYSKYDIIAISDYNKGFLNEEDITYVVEHHNNVFIDTKKILGDWAAKAKFIKINNYEYERSKPYISDTIVNKIIHTKGDQGCIFRGRLYPVAQKVEVRDTSGAGDSFFAALVVKYAETENIERAIDFANECASQVVQHKGVTVIERR